MRWLLLVLLIAAPARAGQADREAELRRLRGEVETLVGKNAWTGVDRAYRAMVALGVPLSTDDHWLGAQAARALGDPNTQHERLTAALAQDPPLEVHEELAMLFAAYGGVTVRVAKDVAPDLEALDPPFDPVMLRTIEAARTALARDRRYVGLLPHGRYVVGGTPFEVVGEPNVRVRAR